VMSQLEKHGKGIILVHDFKHHTAEALPELLRQLKAGGYKVVHLVRAWRGEL
jgi:peptidoglycan/xylan/chitin deacetylase (PgdA/CDA1 family)